MEITFREKAHSFLKENDFEYLYWKSMGMSENWRDDISDPEAFFRDFEQSDTLDEYLNKLSPEEDSMLINWWNSAGGDVQADYNEKFVNLKLKYS